MPVAAFPDCKKARGESRLKSWFTGLSMHVSFIYGQAFLSGKYVPRPGHSGWYDASVEGFMRRGETRTDILIISSYAPLYGQNNTHFSNILLLVVDSACCGCLAKLVWDSDALD